MAKKIKCKFCGEAVNEDKLIYGMTNSINICDKCVDLCNSILAGRKLNKKMDNIPFNPQEIKKKLDEYVIGQDYAKKVLSVAVYNHYKRIFKQDINDKDDVEIQKANLLICGPTGSGKSFLLKTVAKVIDVPIVIENASSITSEGYVGRSIEDVLLRLLNEAGNSVELAQRGIIVFDEIDKIRSSGDNGKDINGTGAQENLLLAFENNTFEVGGSPLGGKTSINTKDILFVCLGAFSGIEEIIARRLNKKTIGFGNDIEKVKINDELIHKVTNEDFVEYGIVRELLGRLQTIVTLDALNEKTLEKVLVEPRDSLIKQYQQLMKYDNVNLDFDDESIKKIANIAFKRKTGARGLRSIVEDSLMNLMYKLPGSKIKQYTVTEKDIIERM